jgi:hypothetical protein
MGAWSILDCARRTSTFLSSAFREQEDDQATLLILLWPRRIQVFYLHPANEVETRKGLIQSLQKEDGVQYSGDS